MKILINLGLFASIFLYPVSKVYQLIVFIRNLFFDFNIFKSVVFEIPIISIGNLSIGGTGKTPMVIKCARLLKIKNKNVAILSRGYGRKSNGFVVVHNGNKMLVPVDQSGDEPYMMAKILGNVPIIVCEDRIKGIKQIIKFFSIDAIILDDGFQNRNLKKNLEIVCISSNEPQYNYKIIPFGRLRESVSSLKRADQVIITKVKKFDLTWQENMIQKYFPRKITKSKLKSELYKIKNKNYIKTLIPQNPLFAFCGIGEPENFLESLKDLGIKICGKIFFRDHQNYNNKIIDTLINRINSLGCNSLVTTEKDYVKLPQNIIDTFDIYIVRINVEFEDENLMIKSMLKLF